MTNSKAKNVIVIGCGIAGLSASIEAAKAGCHVMLVSPYFSERAQSVMAAGGINAALDNMGECDSTDNHAQDTFNGGGCIASYEDILGMCQSAPDIIKRLERIGVAFNRKSDGTIDQRAFGGQSKRRTCYAGTSTGKQIVTALTNEARSYEYSGNIERIMGYTLLSVLVYKEQCQGALIYNENTGDVRDIYGPLVIATGGLNTLYGKTTGSTTCDSGATSELFLNGVYLKNMEFIQFHPTTLDVPQKKLLISEAVRGEGGRLFYKDGDNKVYFMEDKYGSKGNLKTRDLVSREMYMTNRQIYLDMQSIKKERIMSSLKEVYDKCISYTGIDCTVSPIPVMPWPHYFMGGISVNHKHSTNIYGIFACGECSAIYHGANRLGGNSLLGAIHGGQTAGAEAVTCACERDHDFSTYIQDKKKQINISAETKSRFPVVYIQKEIASIMITAMGVARNKEQLTKALSELDFYTYTTHKLKYNGDISVYQNYSIYGRLCLARACICAALKREESIGAHYRTDFPEKHEVALSSVLKYADSNIHISYIDENKR